MPIPAHIRSARITAVNVKLSLEFIQTTRAWIDEDLISALLVAGVLSANVEANLQQPEDLRRFPEPGRLPDQARRPVNAMSVALSLGIPRETARVKLAALFRRGLLERRDGGVILGNDVINSQPFLGAMGSFIKAISEFIDGLAVLEACGVLSGDKMPTPPWSIGGVATRVTTAHVLRGIDYAREINPQLSLTTQFILLSLFHLTGAAMRVPSDEPGDCDPLSSANPATGPVTVAELSRFTGLPDETVRRQVKRLETLGIVVRHRGGYDIELGDPRLVSRWIEFQNRITVSCRQVVWKFFHAGVIVRGKSHGLTLNVLER